MNRTFGFVGIFLICANIASADGPSREENSQGGLLTLTLQDAIRQALAHSPDVAAAELQVARAGEALRETRAMNRPQISAGSGAAYNNGFPLSIEGSAPSIFQVGLSQSIFSSKNRNLIREAEEGIRGSEAASESVRNDLAARTALVYYELFRARKLKELWSARAELSVRDEEITTELLQAGRTRPIDAKMARVAVSQARHRVLIVDEQARIAETELKELTGIASGASIDLEQPRMDNPIFGSSGEELHRKAMETNPEIRQAESELHAREFHMGAEKGEKWPRLEIISQYALFSRANNYEDYFQRFTRNNFILGLSIQVPVFDGSRTNSRVAQSRQFVTESQLKLQSLQTALKLNIERGLSAVKIADGTAEIARMEEEAAREALEVSRSLFEAGRIAPKELDGARLQLSEKEVAALEAAKSAFESRIDLLRVAGMLSTLY